jgi:hypothetical protein
MRFRAITLSLLSATLLLAVSPCHAGDKVHGPGKSISVKKSNNGHVSTFPDVNKSPATDRIIPTPYPDTGESKGTTPSPKKRKMDRKPTSPRGEVEKEKGNTTETKAGVSSGPATSGQQPDGSPRKWKQQRKKKWSSYLDPVDSGKSRLYREEPGQRDTPALPPGAIERAPGKSDTRFRPMRKDTQNVDGEPERLESGRWEWRGND